MTDQLADFLDAEEEASPGDYRVFGTLGGALMVSNPGRLSRDDLLLTIEHSLDYGESRHRTEKEAIATYAATLRMWAEALTLEADRVGGEG